MGEPDRRCPRGDHPTPGAGIRDDQAVDVGHQAIVEAFGGEIGQARALLHGKTSRLRHDGLGIFTGLDNSSEAGRYHSPAVVRVPAEHEVAAPTEAGEVMADIVQHL